MSCKQTQSSRPSRGKRRRSRKTISMRDETRSPHLQEPRRQPLKLGNGLVRRSSGSAIAALTSPAEERERT